MASSDVSRGRQQESAAGEEKQENHQSKKSVNATRKCAKWARGGGGGERAGAACTGARGHWSAHREALLCPVPLETSKNGGQPVQRGPRGIDDVLYGLVVLAAAVARGVGVLDAGDNTPQVVLVVTRTEGGRGREAPLGNAQLELIGLRGSILLRRGGDRRVCGWHGRRGLWRRGCLLRRGGGRRRRGGRCGRLRGRWRRSGFGGRGREGIDLVLWLGRRLDGRRGVLLDLLGRRGLIGLHLRATLSARLRRLALCRGVLGLLLCAALLLARLLLTLCDDLLGLVLGLTTLLGSLRVLGLLAPRGCGLLVRARGLLLLRLLSRRGRDRAARTARGRIRICILLVGPARGHGTHRAGRRPWPRPLRTASAPSSASSSPSS